MAKTKVNVANIKKIQANAILALGGSTAAPRFTGKFELLEQFKSGTSAFYLTEIDDATGLKEEEVIVFVTAEEAEFLTANGGESEYYVSHPFIDGTQTLDMTRNILRLDNEVTNERTSLGLTVSDLNNRGMAKAKALANPNSRFGLALRAKSMLSAPTTAAPRLSLAARAIAAAEEQKVTNAPKPVVP